MKSAGVLPLLLLASILVAGPVAGQPEPLAVVEIASVTSGDGRAVLRLPGTVLSRHDAQISAEVTGRLLWVAEVGDHVDEGKPLAIIDDHLLQLQLRNDWAQIERLKADIAYNQRQIARLERLAEQDNTSKSGLDEARSQLEMLLQEQRIAEVTRDHTVYDLGRTRVAAPFSGIVASRTANLGEYTEPGDPLLRLVDTESLEISVNAPLRASRYNRPDGEVQVEGDVERIVTRIRAMIPVGDSQSRQMELRLTLEPGHWQIGEAVTVELPDSLPASTLSVPRDALVLRDKEVYVFTVSPDNTAIKVPVNTGPGHGNQVAVSGDLKEGAPVVVRGAERLQDGQPVKISRHPGNDSQALN
jgi:RND family efflux transporter MFP subunit